MPLSNPIALIVQAASPLTGATVTVNSATGALLLSPAGALAALTIAMPATPYDGQSVNIGTSQLITAVTQTGGTIVGALTTLALGGFAQFVFSTASATWFRVG